MSTVPGEEPSPGGTLISFFVARLSRLIETGLVGWRLPLAMMAVVFLTSWPAMWLVEPSTSEIAEPGNYFWWFLVTASTVGYGDFFPVTVAGHVVGAYVIVGAIVTLTTLFTRLSASIAERRGLRMTGATTVDLDGHVVILGYTPGRTQRMLSELIDEGHRQVVLCGSDELGSDPIPELRDVPFVRGDLTDVDVLRRAGVDRAEIVVIDARDDNETLAAAVAVDHVNPEINMVATLRDMRRRDHLRYVNPTVQCVQWHTPKLITEEAQDPGIAGVYSDLMSSGGHGNTYSMTLPAPAAGTTVGAVQTHLGRRHGATLLAVRNGADPMVSPPWDLVLDRDAVLYYVADERLGEGALSGLEDAR